MPPTTTVLISTTTTTIGCFCDPARDDTALTVLVGRPYKTFYDIKHSFDSKTLTYWQGVYVENFESLPLGALETHGCNRYFSNRSTYVGPRTMRGGQAQKAQARANHFDLGCGYSGQFNIRCSQTTRQRAMGQCSMTVDISTCKPPTYDQALEACYTVPATTTRMSGPTLPTVPDWLAVEEINFTLAELPPFFNITTQTTTPYPCCEVHVGSVCRPDINFNYPAKTEMGRWQPKPSFERKVGYFPVVPCERQAKSMPRQCPRVKIKELSTAYLQWPHCSHQCNTADLTKEFMQICNRTTHPEIDEKEIEAHKKKIDSMKAKAAQLESWVQKRMSTVTESKQVVDCFDDRLPRRYNALALPQLRSGFDKMPLNNECRLHGCNPNQCLEVKRACKVPFVHQAPEVMCNIYRPNGTFSCVEKIGMWSNNPMSLGFGIAWMVIGSIFLCAGVANFIRQMNADHSASDSTALATRA